MPDGFDPHTELAKIYTLRDLMQSCRERLPKILDVLDEALDNEDPDIKLRAAQMALDRGFGKPRQHVSISDFSEAGQSRVQVYLPDNGRSVTNTGKVVDVD